jgi:hypothetical protein
MTKVCFEVADWSVGEKIIKWFKTEAAARVLDRAEGPDARTIKLDCNGSIVVLYQWDTNDVTLQSYESSMADSLERCKTAFQMV